MAVDAAPRTELPALRRALLGSTLNLTLLRIGERWTLTLIRCAFLGISRFDDFKAATGIPRQTLSLRLEALVEAGLLRREPYQQRPLRHRYRLTPVGLALYPNALLAWDWERRWSTPFAASPATLRHRRCGQPLQPILACGHCHGDVHFEHCSAQLFPPADATLPPTVRARRWAGDLPGERDWHDAPGLQFTRLICDRYSMLILVSVMMGCHRYDQLLQVVNVGTTVLAGRLQMLCTAGLLDKRADRDDGRRFHYALTPPSRALFGYVLTMARWGEQQLRVTPHTLRVVHGACGQPVEPEVVCSACREVLVPWEVDRTASPAASG